MEHRRRAAFVMAMVVLMGVFFAARFLSCKKRFFRNDSARTESGILAAVYG